MSEIILQTKNLTKRYGNLSAIENLNFEINQGEIVGFIGPNGAGKTTTIKLIAKLLTPTNGKIYIRNIRGDLQDINISSFNLINRGFLVDIPIFYNVSAYRLLKYYAMLYRYPKELIEQRIDELLSYFKLNSWKYENVKKYSKGMKQKLGFIQAIIHDPELIILDEPQMGLDPKARIDIRNYLKLLKSQGKTIFLASHILHEISELCNKIILINNGSIVAQYEMKNLAHALKINELTCQILKSISAEKISPILTKMRELLSLYLDKEMLNNKSISPIQYEQQEKTFTIYYDGIEESKSEIFKILGREFESEFSIVSFTQSKTSQLEKIYSEMIIDEEKRTRKRWFKNH